jgi:hypothetical protein
MLKIPAPSKPYNIKKISVLEWLKGYESTLDDDRKNQDGLKTSSNVWLQQNGTIRPRPSLSTYGTAPPGTVLGEIYPYVDSTSGTAVNKLICMCVVTGVANVYISQDGGAWTKCTGKNYSTSAKAHFEQVYNTVLVMNGSDNLSYFSCGTTVITPFTSLATPAITSATVSTNLTSGASIPIYYRVSAVNQGETAGSTDATATVNAVRSQWNLGGRSSDYVTLVWPRITSAQFYNIYCGDQTGLEYYLDTVQDPGTGSNVTYVDDNTINLNTNRLAPNGDSTAGPRVTRATNVLGQVFMVGDADNLYRIWFGGTGSTALDFSAFDGGGWVEVDKGGRDFPVKIHGFREGHGNPVATCLMQGTSGRGKIVHVAMVSTTVGSTVLTYAQIQEGNGQDGTVAPDGVIYAKDALWYPSKNAFKRTGSNPDLLNVLSTDNISDQIIPDAEGLNIKNMAACVGLEYQGRLFWAVPVNNTSNNQIWIYDLNRGGVWTNPWYINADWMCLYDDSSGNTHHLVLVNSIIYELSYKQLTTDGTSAFTVDIVSGLIKFAPDGIDWANVIDVTFVLERPQGSINITVSGKTLDSSSYSSVGTTSFTSNATVVGWDESYWDRAYAKGYNAGIGWDTIAKVPTITGTARTELTIEIDQQMQYLQFEVTSNTPGVDFQLADVVVRYVPIGPLGLSDL